jgi:hypothetical protein
MVQAEHQIGYARHRSLPTSVDVRGSSERRREAMGEHQIGGKGGWGTNQSSGQPPIKRLPNEMPIPSMASIIATLSPGQFPLSHPIWKNRVGL